jgi:regulator of protease activity HflC (stomatin/prohibitin superfamily)
MFLFVLALLIFISGIITFLGSKNFEFLPMKHAGLGMVFVALIIILFAVTVTVPAGQRAVVYDPLGGGVLPNTLGEGFHILMPWQYVSEYSVRTQTFNMHQNGDDVAVSVLTGEGLEVSVDLSVIYHLNPEKLSEMHRNVGEEYREVLIKPVSRAIARDIISTYRSEDLYTTEKRVALQGLLTNKIQAKLSERGIEVESVLVRDIQLPMEVKGAIESKITAEQDAKRMEFVLQKEGKEAQRKIVEAQGVSESQKIISESLNERFLTWFWISSLEKQNSVIYVPIGQNGLPLFKNVDQAINQTQ